MSALATLWSVSLALAALVIGIVLVLLLARVVAGRIVEGRRAERQRLVNLLLGQSDSGAADAPRLLLGRKDVAVSLTVELIQLVQGSERDRLVALAHQIGVPERVRHLMDSGSPRVRLAAAEALAQFGDKRSMERLRFALADRNSEVRFASALALASLGEAPPARELIERLGIGTREQSLLAVNLFRHIADRRPCELKALLVEEDIPARAKVAVIEGLAASADYSLVPLIVSLAGEESDPAILVRYMSVLGTFGHPAGEPAIRRGLQHPEGDVRAAAAEAAARIGLVNLVPHLRELLDDRQWWVRFKAAQALAQVGPEGVEQLRSVASSSGEPARSAASLTMAERGIP